MSEVRVSRAWADPQVKKERIRSIRRRQVLRLLHARHGATLPDNQRSRAALQLLFELGLTGPAANELAPWANGDEIEHLIAAAEANWVNWSRFRDRGDNSKDTKLIPERIGERLEMTFEEYKNFELSHLRPADVQRHQVDQYLFERRTTKDAVRKMLKRQKARAERPLIDEAVNLPSDTIQARRAKSLILGPLVWQRWWTVSDLTEYFLIVKVVGNPFARLDRVSARQAVLRSVKHIECLGFAETRRLFARHGFPQTHVRRVYTQREIELEEQQVMEEMAVEQGIIIVESDDSWGTDRYDAETDLEDPAN